MYIIHWNGLNKCHTNLSTLSFCRQRILRQSLTTETTTSVTRRKDSSKRGKHNPFHSRFPDNLHSVPETFFFVFFLFFISFFPPLPAFVCNDLIRTRDFFLFFSFFIFIFIFMLGKDIEIKVRR